jgi:peptide subunit release factor 1 (eRF1)
MLEFLDALEKTGDATANTVYLLPGMLANSVKEVLKKAFGTASVPEELNDKLALSKTGGALFWGSTRKCLVLPPFPLREQAVFTGLVTEPLRRLLEVDYAVGLVLVHLGAYAVGLCRGEKLVTSKVGTGLVHGRHKKGGSSQMRFQRRREQQATEFLDRVCLHAREHLEPQAGLIDYMVYGGPHQTVMQLRKHCPFLNQFQDRVLTTLDVPDPRREVLEKAVVRIWSSRINEWREEV